MRGRRGVAAALVLVGAAASVGAVTIEPLDGGFRAKAEAYEATIGADGALTSLKVQDTEFLHSAADFPRGAYAWQDGLVALAGVGVEGGTVTAEDDRANLAYRFTDTGLTLTMANKTDKSMLYVIVFDQALQAMRGEDGRFRRTPLARQAPSATWFRLPARLTIAGGERAWGPWGGGHQVWQAGLGPKQTATITMEVGMATPEEQQQTREAVERVVPPPTDPVGPMWDLDRFGRAPTYEEAAGYEWAETAEGVRPIFFDGPDYEGQPTKVFAWLGVPEAPVGTKLPGMVLVPGGGGTAFAHWVKMWNDRGYAAISMDTCGCVPVGSYGNWERHRAGGPPGWGGFDQIDHPREDQWAFHAVASALLANSLLRSLPEVDPDRIGVTGISWGGYLTSLIAGVDPRFALAAPVYGCGYTLDMTFGESVRGLGAERTDRWMRWWDPSAYLGNAAMPILWINGTNDFAYTMPGWQKSYRAPRGPRALSMRIRMPHGHTEGEVPEEIHAFANQVLRGETPLCRITGQGRADDRVWATFEAQSPIARAELCATTATGPWTDRQWDAYPASVEAGRVSATLPGGTTCYFLALTDERGLLVSTEPEEPR